MPTTYNVIAIEDCTNRNLIPNKNIYYAINHISYQKKKTPKLLFLKIKMLTFKIDICKISSSKYTHIQCLN